MISNFQAKYSETEDVLKDICRLNAAEKVMPNHMITVAVVGFGAAVVLIFKFGALEGLSPSQTAMKVGLYLALWALAFVAACFLAKTIGMKSAIVGAEGEGSQVYRQRIQKWGRPLDVKIDFYDEYLTTWAKGLQKQKVDYAEVTKLLESSETIAVIAKMTNDYKTRLFAFPKAGVDNDEVEALKKFLEEKCVNAKKGFKTCTYTYKKKEK